MDEELDSWRSVEMRPWWLSWWRLVEEEKREWWWLMGKWGRGVAATCLYSGVGLGFPRCQQSSAFVSVAEHVARITRAVLGAQGCGSTIGRRRRCLGSRVAP